MRVWTLLVAMVFAGGCTPLASVTGARTLGAGRKLAYASAGAFKLEQMRYVENDHGDTRDVQRKDWALPQLEVGFRYGLNDRIDVGGRVSPCALAAETSIQLLRSRWVDLAAAPMLISQITTPSDDGLAAQVPLLLGLNLAPSFQVVGAAIVRGEIENPSGDLPRRAGVFAGGSFALAWWIDDRVLLQPELVALWPVVAGPELVPATGPNGDHDIMHSPRYHLGIGVGVRW